MALEILRHCITFGLNCLTIWTLSRVLVMRSNKAFAISSLASIVLAQAMAQFHAPDTLRMIEGIVTFGFGLPIGLSIGPLPNRIARTVLVNLAAFASEFVGVGAHILLTGSPLPDFGDANNLSYLLASYAVITLAAGFLFEGVVLVCNRSTDSQDTAFERPVLIAMLWSVILCATLECLLRGASAFGTQAAMTTLVSSILALGLGVAAIPLAQHEAKTRRQLANRMASARQVKHVRSEIEASMRRSAGIQRLHHVTANCADTLLEQAESGKVTEADRYLAALQEQAASVARE
jgi:hypothetical protein